MTHVITQSCCNDAACTSVCPVDCIHPTPEERDYTTTELLYIDPDTCIDCGSCVTECPVDAIYSDHDLPDHMSDYLGINAAFFEGRTLGEVPRRNAIPSRVEGSSPLRVAIVGSGPAGAYTAKELLAVAGAGVELDIYDRLPTPWGLARCGVAPDHLATKAIATSFAELGAHRRVTFQLNVEVGRHVTVDEMRRRYHAVVFAHGASSARSLGIEGENLPGSASATDFVAWYNGNPEAQRGHVFDLSGRRVVIVGNGNVALDIARLLMVGPSVLHASDMSGPAVHALSHHHVDDVMIIGRRGVLDAACSLPELKALGELEGADVVVSPEDLILGAADVEELDRTPMLRLKYKQFKEFAARARTSKRSITFRFNATPTRIVGTHHVEAIKLAKSAEDSLGLQHRDQVEVVKTPLVLRSIGYAGVALPGLPFDRVSKTVPSDGARVISPDGDTIPGLYATGWIKRGPSGSMGTNKQDARHTVTTMLEDARLGRLATPASTVEEVHQAVRARQPDVVT